MDACDGVHGGSGLLEYVHDNTNQQNHRRNDFRKDK